MNDMLNSQNQFFIDHYKELKLHQLELRDYVLSFGGKNVILWNGHNSIEFSKLFCEIAKPYQQQNILLRRGEPSNCHENSIVLAKKINGLWYTGYALSKDDIWRPHSWVVKGSTIYETTEKRIQYLGFNTKLLGNIEWLL